MNIPRRLEDKTAKPSKIEARYSQVTCRTARTVVHHYNGTQYCSTETVLLIFRFLQTNITSGDKQFYCSSSIWFHWLQTHLHRQPGSNCTCELFLQSAEVPQKPLQHQYRSLETGTDPQNSQQKHIPDQVLCRSSSADWEESEINSVNFIILTSLLVKINFIIKQEFRTTKKSGTPPASLALLTQSSSSSRMRDMNHNWSASKQRLHPQSVAEISRHLVLSGDRIRQCGTSSGSRHKDIDQCL